MLVVAWCEGEEAFEIFTCSRKKKEKKVFFYRTFFRTRQKSDDAERLNMHGMSRNFERERETNPPVEYAAN